MEKEIKIKTDDEHIIYGVLSEPKKKSEKLVIFVHGLGGHINEHTFFNITPHLTKKGFCVFRFYLYSWHKNARRLKDTTISLHARDLEVVAKHFKNKYSKLYAVGHSFGGPTILSSDTSLFSAIVLWDPSDGEVNLSKDEDCRYEKRLGNYIVDWGVEILIGKKMVEESKKLPSTLSTKMSQIKAPLKIISAGKGILHKRGKRFIKPAPEPKEFVVIQNADHNFNNHEAERKLFDETYKWLKKY